MVIVSDIQLPKNADGILKVSDVSTAAGGDLSARQTITDPSTSTFVKTDAVGRLNVLESDVEGGGVDNSLNATEYNVKQMGAFDGAAYRVAKCDNKGRLANLAHGNTLPDGSGDTHAIHVDTNGNLRVSTVSTVNTAPANSANSGITDDPANSYAVGLRGRTNIAQANTETFLLCDATGHLQVDIQNNANVKLEDLSSQLNADTTDDPNNSIAVGLKGRQTIGTASTSTFLLCDGAGKLRNISDNLYQQVFVSQGLASGQGEILPANGVEMNNSSGSNVEVYINYGGASGATAGDFTFQVHESWDNVDYYLNSSATFGQVLQNVDAVVPKAVKTGMFQFDGRFLKVKVVNNSGNPQDINAYVYVKK